jgi:hypothetical protein
MFSEFFPCGLPIEQKTVWLGSMLLAISADIASISPHDAEYIAAPGAGMFIAGLIACGVKAYRERSSYDDDPDDPEREEIEPSAEIIQLYRPQELGVNEKKVA